MIATNCQACHLVQLIQKIINFLIGLSIPIAAALFAYAGVLMFASADNPGRIITAKNIFKKAGIGFLIAITAWLVINTVLHVLLDRGDLFQGGNWFSIQCVDDTNNARPRSSTITQLLGSLPILGGITNNGLPSIGGISSGELYNNGEGGALTYSGGKSNSYGCAQGYVLDTINEGTNNEYNACVQYDQYGGITNEQAVTCGNGATLSGSKDFTSNDYTGICVNANGTEIDPYAGTGVGLAPTQTGTGACAPENMTNSWGSAASAMSCIASKESSCNPSLSSGVDKISTGEPFSWGMYQINLTANNMQCPGGQTLNCPQAFSGKNFGAKIVNQGLYNDCVEAAKDINCNTYTAQQLLKNPKGIKNWSTAAACGL